MEQVVDEAVVAEVPRITHDFATAALRRMGLSAEGLWPVERAYLDLLPGGGQAVSLARIAQGLGLDARAVSQDVEPRLLRRDLVRVTPQGRVRSARARPARAVPAIAANGALPGG